MKQNMQLSRIRIPWKTLAVIGLAAFVGALVTSYVYHRANVWVAGGVWCTHFTPTGGVERLYGSMCD